MGKSDSLDGQILNMLRMAPADIDQIRARVQMPMKEVREAVEALIADGKLTQAGTVFVLPDSLLQKKLYPFVVEQWLSPGPGPGHWYECRRVNATDTADAYRLAWPDGHQPRGYRLRML